MPTPRVCPRTLPGAGPAPFQASECNRYIGLANGVNHIPVPHATVLLCEVETLEARFNWLSAIMAWSAEARCAWSSTTRRPTSARSRRGGRTSRLVGEVRGEFQDDVAIPEVLSDFVLLSRTKPERLYEQARQFVGEPERPEADDEATLDMLYRGIEAQPGNLAVEPQPRAVRAVLRLSLAFKLMNRREASEAMAIVIERRSWQVGVRSLALAGALVLGGGGAVWAAGNVTESSADSYPTSHVALWPDAPVKLTFVRWYEQTYCFAWIDGTSLIEVGCPSDLYIDQDIPEETGPAT